MEPRSMLPPFSNLTSNPPDVPKIRSRKSLICPLAGTWRDIPTPTVETNFERFVAAIGAGAAALPDFDRGAVLQSALDAAVTSDATNCGDTTV